MSFPNKRKYIGIGQIELKNIGISAKNPILCIPTLNNGTNVSKSHCVIHFNNLLPPTNA